MTDDEYKKLRNEFEEKKGDCLELFYFLPVMMPEERRNDLINAIETDLKQFAEFCMNKNFN